MSAAATTPIVELREHLTESRALYRAEGLHRPAFRAEVELDIVTDEEAVLHSIHDSAQAIAETTREILADGKVSRSEVRKLRQLARVAEGIAADANV